MKKMVKMFLGLAMVTMLVGCGKGESNVEVEPTIPPSFSSLEPEEYEECTTTFTWPTMGYATRLPQPTRHTGVIDVDRADWLDFTIYGTSDEEHEDYISKCQEAGFVNDYERYYDDYIGYSDDGVRLRVARITKYGVVDSTWVSVYYDEDYVNEHLNDKE